MINSLSIITLCLIGASLAIPGGWSDVDANRDDIKHIIDLAVQHRNSQVNSLYYRNVASVTSARVQVVSGFKYEVKMVLGETHCARVDAGGKLCPVSPNGLREACVYTFYLAPAADEPEILSSSCTKIQ